MATTRDIYQEITDRIIEALEQGVVPWIQPWTSTKPQGLPANASTERPYNGINVVLLWLTAMERGYSDHRWLTFKQSTALGGTVRKGEKGTLITFWRILKRPNEKGELETLPILRHYTVFNVQQTEGLDLTAEALPEVDLGEDFPRAHQLLQDTGAHVADGAMASYIPSLDLIRMPPAAAFTSLGAYWATLLHELTHWTGAPERLARPHQGRFGDEAYAFEELVAEMGSAFLCAQVGVPLEGLQHPGYIDHWLKVLRDDKRALIRAASQARKASEFLLPAAVDEASEEAA